MTPAAGATRRLVPELEARRHLLDGYASFRELPDEVNALWKAPFGPPEDWDLHITPTTIPGPHGPVPVRVYLPTTPAPDEGRPCLVWMHGGAFAWGDLDMPEAHEVARGVAGRADAVVVSVDYRLCPVPPEFGGTAGDRLDDDGRPVCYPVPQDDCAAVLEAVRAAPDSVGADPRRIAIDRTMLGGGRETATPYAYAGVSDDLSGFPPTYVENDEFDAFRASGHRFAEQLRTAGVDVVEVTRQGVPHGHLDLVGFAPAAATLDALAARLTAA